MMFTVLTHLIVPVGSGILKVVARLALFNGFGRAGTLLNLIP